MGLHLEIGNEFVSPIKCHMQMSESELYFHAIWIILHDGHIYLNDQWRNPMKCKSLQRIRSFCNYIVVSWWHQWKLLRMSFAIVSKDDKNQKNANGLHMNKRFHAHCLCLYAVYGIRMFAVEVVSRVVLNVSLRFHAFSMHKLFTLELHH